MDEGLVIFTRDRVAELAGVKSGRLSYWERTGLVSPTVSEHVSLHRTVRLYDFHDMMSVLIIAALREHVSLQHIRQVVEYLRHLDFCVPQIQFAIAGTRVFFQTPDGEWAGTSNPAQIVLWQTLDLVPLRARVEAAARRDPATVGQTERRRGARGSKPVIAGTRVPVATILAFLARGATVEEVIDAYPDLEPADVERARAFASA